MLGEITSAQFRREETVSVSISSLRKLHAAEMEKAEEVVCVESAFTRPSRMQKGQTAER